MRLNPFPLPPPARGSYPAASHVYSASGAGGEGAGAGAEDGGGASGKKKKGKSAKMIPLELQRLFARLQLLDSRTVSTEVHLYAACVRACMNRNAIVEQPPLEHWAAGVGGRAAVLFA